jgi:hypothetical protein
MLGRLSGLQQFREVSAGATRKFSQSTDRKLAIPASVISYTLKECVRENKTGRNILAGSCAGPDCDTQRAPKPENRAKFSRSIKSKSEKTAQTSRCDLPARQSTPI